MVAIVKEIAINEMLSMVKSKRRRWKEK